MLRTILLGGCCLSVGLLPAAEIYSCVDSEGITHFSEEPISDCSGAVETITIEVQQPAPGDDHYSVQRQLERLEKHNAELEKQRLEKQLLREQIEASRQRARAARRAAEAADTESPPAVVPIFVPPPRHRPHPHPHKRPLPPAPPEEEPGYRPPAEDR